MINGFWWVVCKTSQGIQGIKELKQADIEKADLVNIEQEEQPCCYTVCQSTLIEEMYHWHIGAIKKWK